jgi:hypothetical protein
MKSSAPTLFVGAGGFGPPTSRSQTECSDQTELRPERGLPRWGNDRPLVVRLVDRNAILTHSVPDLVDPGLRRTPMDVVHVRLGPCDVHEPVLGGARLAYRSLAGAVRARHWVDLGVRHRRSQLYSRHISSPVSATFHTRSLVTVPLNKLISTPSR